MTDERIKKLRLKMSKDYLDAVLVTSRSNVLYLSGFSGSDGDLIITHDTQYILCDARYTEQAGQQCPEFECIDIKEGLYTVINKLVDYHRIVRMGVEDRAITYAVYDGMKNSIKSTITPIGDMVSQMREVKDKSELVILEKAAAIGDLAYKAAIKAIKPGVSEIEIAAEIEYVMRKNGATAPSFETIVASGENSSKPHGTASQRKIKNGDLIVLDFGCIYKGYCSDMTRTVAVGDISVSQKNTYNALLYTQMKMVNIIKNGMQCNQVDKIARNILENLGYAKYFTHSLGHGVGIDIHEMPNLSPKCEKTLAEGMVITVEPGVYFDGLFGIRIEDTVEILDKNIKIITNSPKELLII